MRAQNPTSENLITSLESIKNFVAGKDEHWKSAQPISTPRTFSAEDHVGVKTITPVMIKEGKFIEP